ncbi:Prefoldin subunit alpha [Candidatus Bilamarchaeum dharawalense]|uniref:Prefoldin subunit alpha n=1 Tax=Candidatus Bilamarchaeum dharawalense TaxID=2885759 RepID=A0A5E4LPF9_9ARCH|nr:Prefoldin subunit alpha [Candidatus Bilamarchaeum dharawalense]
MTSPAEVQAQLSYELAVYREQINLIKRETERVSLTTIDLNNALKTVENMSADRILVPIGGGALVRGQLMQTRVMVPIGAEYLVEMSKEEATEEIRKRIDATKKAVEKLTEEFNKIALKLREASGQLQQLQTQTQINRTVDGNIREDYI